MGTGGVAAGDLYLKISIAPHPVFRINGIDLEVDVPVTPWEAALGAEIDVPTVDGSARVTIPQGFQSNQKLRLKEKGLKNGAQTGYLYVNIRIVVPKKLKPNERTLFKQLAETSSFQPRRN